MPPSESRPDAAIGIAGLTPPSESCGNRSRFPPVAVHARVIVCVLYRPATVVFRVSGEYPMSLSRFGIVGLVLAAGLGPSDRKSVVWGQSVSVRVDLGGPCLIQKNIN